MNAVRNAPWICAHAGCEGFPLDGLQAIEAGIAAGADWVEIDLRFTSDGIGILAHDRLDGRPVPQLTTLDQALDLLANHPRVGINVDVKDPKAMAQYPTRLTLGSIPNPVYCTGLTAAQVPAFQKACPGLACAANDLPWWFPWASRRTKIDTIVGYKRRGIVALNLDYRTATPDLVSLAREVGLPVRVWTVDSTAAMVQMAAIGVESITTNRVTELKRLLAPGLGKAPSAG